MSIFETTFTQAPPVTAADLTLADAGGFFTTDNPEAALQQIGADADYIDPTVVDLTVFTSTLIIGGGGKSLSRTGTNPIDPLAFESNGSYNGLHNTFAGRGAGDACITGNGNTFVGALAGERNVNGDQNTYVGWAAGEANIAGYHNTYLGVGAGQNDVTGYFNTFVGCDCALSANGCHDNIAVGASTFAHATSAHDCSAIGNNTLINNTSGYYNVAVGNGAQYAGTINYQNTSVGYYSLSLVDGQYSNNNSALGFGAGRNLTIGSRNTFLGSYAGYIAAQAAQVSNTIAIGFEAVTTVSNTCQIGNADLVKVLTHGDFEAQDIGDGFICKSPDGTRYRITVANGGTIAIAAA